MRHTYLYEICAKRLPSPALYSLAIPATIPFFLHQFSRSPLNFRVFSPNFHYILGISTAILHFTTLVPSAPALFFTFSSGPWKHIFACKALDIYSHSKILFPYLFWCLRRAFSLITRVLNIFLCFLFSPTSLHRQWQKLEINFTHNHSTEGSSTTDAFSSALGRSLADTPLRPLKTISLIKCRSIVISR